MKVVSGTRGVGRAKWRQRRRCAVIAAWVVTLLGSNTVHAQCMYRIEAELSAPAGALTLGVSAINDNNMIVGSFLTSSFTFRPYMWTAETGVVPIPLPPGVSEAQAEDVNIHGEIVGFLTREGVGQRAFRYNDGVWTELPPTGGGTSSSASAINDDGWAAGERGTSPGQAGLKAVRWRDDIVDELTSWIRGESARASDINLHKDATGTFGALSNGRAFLWQGDEVTLIPPIESDSSTEGRAIDDSAEVVVRSRVRVKSGSVPFRSWIFRNGELTDLGTLPEADHRTTAFDINNAGQIVGRAEGVENATNTAFFWQHGEIIELETLVVDPPDFLWLGGALAINNHGFIVASNQAFGGQFLLAPVDRPPGDVNIDCIVDERDLIAVLEDWGPDKFGHPTDMVSSATFQPPGDGQVDAADLAFVLGNWSIASSQSLPVRR